MKGLLISKKIFSKFWSSKEKLSENSSSDTSESLGSTNEEEKGKGKTVEVGRAHFEPETTRFTILDAWGHKNYVPNMISDASQVDIGMLVIYAQKVKFETGGERSGNEGFFVKPIAFSKFKTAC